MGTLGINCIYSVGRVVRQGAVRDRGLLPRGFDSLRISMQNSSQFLVLGGESAWEHFPVHVVQESQPGMVVSERRNSKIPTPGQGLA